MHGWSRDMLLCGKWNGKRSRKKNINIVNSRIEAQFSKISQMNSSLTSPPYMIDFNSLNFTKWHIICAVFVILHNRMLFGTPCRYIKSEWRAWSIRLFGAHSKFEKIWFFLKISLRFEKYFFIYKIFFFKITETKQKGTNGLKCNSMNGNFIWNFNALWY